jgi:hypothetical protein
LYSFNYPSSQRKLGPSFHQRERRFKTIPDDSWVLAFAGWTDIII